MDHAIKAYANRVQEMREAQREYFKARKMKLESIAADWLVKSRAAERSVDILTAEILASSTPGKLFT